MADHFKLEIGASGTKITTFTNVDDNFAENFRDMLQAGKEAKNLKLLMISLLHFNNLKCL